MIMLQGSTSQANNIIAGSSNDYLSALSNQQQDMRDEFALHYAAPAGCAYSNPACLNLQKCNATNNSCYAFVNTTRNGCAYSNPACPTGYNCTVANTCRPA